MKTAGNHIIQDALKTPYAQALQRTATLRASEAYRIMVTTAACALTGEQQEETYHAAIRGVNRTDLDLIMQAFGELIVAMNTRPYQDLLGPLYMALTSQGSKKLGGEFFTPPSLCRMMAELNFAGPGIVPEDRPLDCSEPCCGTGGMVLAATEVLKRETGSTLHARWLAQDLNQTSAYACFVNLSLWGVPATVRCGNSLGDDFRWSWETAFWPLACGHQPGVRTVLPWTTPGHLLSAFQQGVLPISRTG